jgi:hypothetical protein
MTKVKQPLFPRTLAEAIADLDLKRDYLTTNETRFGIEAADLEKVETSVNAAQAAYKKASEPKARTTIDIENRNLAMKKAQDTVRKVIGFYVTGNPNATVADYDILRIPIPGLHPPLPDPEDPPGISHLTSKSMAIYASFFDKANGHRGKPAGVQSIEACIKVGGEPPASPEEMSERRVGTDSPMHLQFEFEQLFQLAFVAFRWVGTHGVYGPWSEIYKINIAR